MQLPISMIVSPLIGWCHVSLYWLWVVIDALKSAFLNDHIQPRRRWRRCCWCCHRVSDCMTRTFAYVYIKPGIWGRRDKNDENDHANNVINIHSHSSLDRLIVWNDLQIFSFSLQLEGMVAIKFFTSSQSILHLLSICYSSWWVDHGL